MSDVWIFVNAYQNKPKIKKRKALKWASVFDHICSHETHVSVIKNTTNTKYDAIVVQWLERNHAKYVCLCIAIINNSFHLKYVILTRNQISLVCPNKKDSRI